MKRISTILIFIFFCNYHSSNASTLHEKGVPLTISLELSSKYMWRGNEYGTAPTLFPMISFNKAGFNIFGMGAYAFDGSHQEVDLGISYTYKWLTLGISDYYYPSAVGEKDNYFDFSHQSTGHSIEAYITAYPFKFPFWITLSTYVFGNDKNLDGKQAYSSYMEIGYNHYFDNKNILSVIAGANLNKGFYTNYNDRFNLVNTMLKYTYNLTIKSFILPISASYIINPYKEKSFFTFSSYFNF